MGSLFAFKSLNLLWAAAFAGFFDAFMVFEFLTLRVSALWVGNSDYSLKKYPLPGIL